MRIHLFPLDGGHKVFKTNKTSNFLVEDDVEKGVLYTGAAGVIWKENEKLVIMLPWSQVKTIHLIDGDARAGR